MLRQISREQVPKRSQDAIRFARQSRFAPGHGCVAHLKAVSPCLGAVLVAPLESWTDDSGDDESVDDSKEHSDAEDSKARLYRIFTEDEDTPSSPQSQDELFLDLENGMECKGNTVLSRWQDLCVGKAIAQQEMPGTIHRDGVR